MTILWAAAALVAVCWSAVVALRFKSACIFIALAMFILLWEFPRTGISISVGSTQVYIEDILALLMLIVAATTTVEGGRRSRGPGLLISAVLAVTLAAGLVGGLHEYGLASAANEFREYFHAIAVFVYVYTLLVGHWRDVSGHIRAMTLVGFMLTGMTLYHIATNGLGGADSWVDIGGGEYQTGRPLVAAQALFLMCVGLVLLGRWLERGSRRDLSYAGTFLVVSALCQHRSVWAATATGVAILAAYSIWRGRMAIAVLVVVATYLLTMAASTGLLSGVEDSLAGSLNDSQTYDARTLSWESLVDENLADGPMTVLLGDNWGAGWERLDRNGDLIDFRPHNTYVSMFLRCGLIGLAVMVLGMLVVARRLFLRRDAVRLAVFAAIASYCWAYDIDRNVILFVAWAVHGATTRDRLDDVASSRPPDDRIDSGWTSKVKGRK